MISDVFKAVFWAGLPVGLCSYGLAWWAIKQGYIESVSNVKGLEKALKNRKKDKKLIKEGDAVHRKWLAFGGGFYGVIALLTYVLVEAKEILGFISQLGGLVELIRSLSFDLIINLVIDAFKNFILAISWPAYWIGELRNENPWVWLIVAYAGYWVGGHLAVRQSEPNDVSDI